MLPRLLEGVEPAAYALPGCDGLKDVFHLYALEILDKFINSLNFTGGNFWVKDDSLKETQR